MALSPPAPRKHLHHRRVTFDGYRREDGMWDIEAELVDVKSSPWQSIGRGLLPAETPVHHMRVRLTVDDALEIHGAEVEMASTPYDTCHGAIPGLQELIGAKMSSGWRKAVETRLGGIAGCTHIRELLVNMGTAAYQTLVGEQLRSRESAAAPSSPPPHMGKCIAWDFGGPVVATYFPQFHRPKPKTDEDNDRARIGLDSP
jgi:hypothetical protein